MHGRHGWILLPVVLVLVALPSQGWVTPCPGEDPRFVVDKEFPKARLGVTEPARRVGAFVPAQSFALNGWGTVNASPEAYQLTLWEALSDGSGAGADYVLTIAKPYEWFQVVWKDSTAGGGLGAYLSPEPTGLRLVIMGRAGDGECHACPQSIDVKRHRWDTTRRELLKESAYRTRCKY
ncbi:MAG: hypothetical protein ACREMY_10435 [bacterium]